VFGYKYKGIFSPASAGIADVSDLFHHSRSEGGLWGEREPTQEEMNLMVDEIRLAYQKTFGDEAYAQAVSEKERKLTADRLAKRGNQGMLIE